MWLNKYNFQYLGPDTEKNYFKKVFLLIIPNLFLLSIVWDPNIVLYISLLMIVGAFFSTFLKGDKRNLTFIRKTG